LQIIPAAAMTDATQRSEMEEFLTAGAFVDSDAPSIVAFAKQAAGAASDPLAAALRLYAAVRDGIIYDPYVDLANPANYRASGVLAGGRGFCCGKSAVLAASARAIGIPARVGYADVRNHLTSPRMYERMQTDIFRWHSYTEFYLDGRWVKATPAFDRRLCDRVGLKPLEFDGRTDSLFHEFDRAGRRHMEYLLDRGPFVDVPFDAITADFRANYPGLMRDEGLAGDFHAEAVASTAKR
jgi:transglutaminase-like putative cysteine protease